MPAIFSRIQGLRDLLALLSKVQIEDITRLIGLVGVIQDERALIKDRVLAVIEAADVLVDYTETQTDDLLVEFVKGLAKDDAIWQVVALVQDLLDGGAVPVGALEGEGLVVGASGPDKPKQMIPWPLVIQLAQVIATLIMGLKK
jgi:hypothetical protein